MVFVNCSHADRLGHQAGLSKVTTQKQLIYHQKREKSRECPNFLRERERERERDRERQRERETERQRDRETERQRERV